MCSSLGPFGGSSESDCTDLGRAVLSTSKRPGGRRPYTWLAISTPPTGRAGAGGEHECGDGEDGSREATPSAESIETQSSLGTHCDATDGARAGAGCCFGTATDLGADIPPTPMPGGADIPPTPMPGGAPAPPGVGGAPRGGAGSRSRTTPPQPPRGSSTRARLAPGASSHRSRLPAIEESDAPGPPTPEFALALSPGPPPLRPNAVGQSRA